MITIRLSEEEHSALRRFCAVSGARSVSDLTRDAVRAFLGAANRERDQLLDVHMDEFRNKISSLDRKIEQLLAEVTSVKTNGNL